ncbi:MAG: replication protein [Ignavibacteriales bacterium]|nr:replication protein [Ignavibacteriales bacterium]
MASPQVENGYIKISNEIMEALSKTKFRGSTRNMLDCIFRKTYGFNKKEDKISLSQFVEMTNLSKRTVIYGLQELEAMNIILVKRQSNDGLKEINTYSFNKNYETWVVQNSAPQVKRNRILAKISSAKLREMGNGSAKLGGLVVQNSENNLKSFAHTKDTNTKDNTKDRDMRDSPTIWRSIFPNKTPGIVEITFVEGLREKFGSIKASQVLFNLRESNFNSIRTMREALNEDGSIKPKENNGTNKKDSPRGTIDFDKYEREREASKPRGHTGVVSDAVPKRIQ